MPRVSGALSPARELPHHRRKHWVRFICLPCKFLSRLGLAACYDRSAAHSPLSRLVPRLCCSFLLFFCFFCLFLSLSFISSFFFFPLVLSFRLLSSSLSLSSCFLLPDPLRPFLPFPFLSISSPPNPTPSSVILVGGDLSGLRHAISTFMQCVRLCGAADDDNRDTPMEGEAAVYGVPALRIVDWPLLSNRGFMLDVSRDKVRVCRFRQTFGCIAGSRAISVGNCF